jgi:hypothetical protein
MAKPNKSRAQQTVQEQQTVTELLAELEALEERSNCLDCQGDLVYFFSSAPPGVARASDASAWR